jgi:hypothetical protein
MHAAIFFKSYILTDLVCAFSLQGIVDAQGKENTKFLIVGLFSFFFLLTFQKKFASKRFFSFP